MITNLKAARITKDTQRDRDNNSKANEKATSDYKIKAQLNHDKRFYTAILS